jgi:hypothetical protein
MKTPSAVIHSFDVQNKRRDGARRGALIIDGSMIRSVAPLGRELSTMAPPNAVGSTILHLLALERIHNTPTIREKHKFFTPAHTLKKTPVSSTEFNTTRNEERLH